MMTGRIHESDEDDESEETESDEENEVNIYYGKVVTRKEEDDFCPE